MSAAFVGKGRLRRAGVVTSIYKNAKVKTVLEI